jgi:primosomal protein N' (replication factor Y)
VAPVKPLRLKSERAEKSAGAIASVNPCVEVIVDSGVYHLDNTFSYLVPQSLSATCFVGSRIQVPFNGRELEAIVVKRSGNDSAVGFKVISKVITPFPVASEQSLQLVLEVARHWAAHPYDVIRSAIPPRVAAVDKKEWSQETSLPKNQRAVIEYLQFPPHENPYLALCKYLADSKGKGSILIVVPDSRAIERLLKLLPDAIVLDSQLDRTDRYENYLRAKYGAENIIVGTRSAIFADVCDLSRIIVIDEGSESFYEPRTPGWNVRDVAQIRSELNDLPLTFLGYSPSAEIGAMIETGTVAYRNHAARLHVDSFQPEFAELLPGKVIKEIRGALHKGPVLVIAPRKGYAQGIQCSKCRNIALCACGGKYVKEFEVSDLECTLCGEKNGDWSCSWCQNRNQFLVSRGSSRFAHEIGRAITGVPIASSEGDHILDDGSITNGIVIATPGAAPFAVTGYSAVVFLESESLLSQADIRAQERARDIFFSHSALVAHDGKILLIINHENPLVGSLASWKPSLLLQKDLRDRVETALPPSTFALSIDAQVSESAALVQGFEQARKDARLPSATRILGPSLLKSGLHRILVMVPRDSSPVLTELVHEFQRRRSASGKSLLSMRIEPYSLSR